MEKAFGSRVSYLVGSERVYRRLLDMVVLRKLPGTKYGLYAIVLCRFNGCVELVEVDDNEFRFEVVREQTLLE